jgi:hypothetical protein
MKHIWSFALLATVVGCAAEPVDDLEDPPSGQDDGDGDGGGGGGSVDTPDGCEVGAIFGSDLHRFARGGELDIDIDDGGIARPRTIRSSAPEIMTVVQTYAGATVTGVAPGTAELEVWRCDHRIASYPIEVVEVADVEVRLSYGFAGHSDPLTALVGLAPGAADQLEVTYFDDQHVALPGRGAARFTFEGEVRPGPSISLGLAGCAGTPCDLVPIAIHGAGRVRAIAGGREVAIDVTTTPAPAELELELVELPLDGAYALEVLGETATGQPIAGLAPTFTITPATAFEQLPTEPRTSQLLLIGQPHGAVTFTATVAGVTRALTLTFP